MFDIKAEPITETETETETTWDDISVEGNEIFFSTEVNDESICYLFKIMRQLERKLLACTVACPDYKPEIRLYINSVGGDMFAGFSGHDQMTQLRVKVTTIAVGCCASAATFLLLGGHKRLIAPRAHILIHQIATDGFWGKFEDLKDEMKNCEKFMKMAKDIYHQHCDIPEKKMKNIMKKDIYLTPKKCVKWGIVEGILEPKKINY